MLVQLLLGSLVVIFTVIFHLAGLVFLWQWLKRRLASYPHNFHSFRSIIGLHYGLGLGGALLVAGRIP